MWTTISTMKQLGLGLNLSTKKTRKREFLEEMERVVPWGVLVQIVEPYYPKAKTGRPPFGIETMLRIHYLHVWTRRLLQARADDVKLVCVHVYGLLVGKCVARPQPR
jgi:IS5 family transposase